MRVLVFSLLIFLFTHCSDKRQSQSHQLFPIKEYGKWGYINQEGIIVIPCEFDFASDFVDALAAVKIDSLWGFINSHGKIVIKPKYSNGDERFPPRFSDGLCHVQEKTDSGLVNLFIKKDGSTAFISPYGYWEVGNFIDGRARVEIDEEVCFIDKKGRVVIKTGFPYGWTFREGLGHVWTGDSTQYIDTTGRVVIAVSGMGHGDFNEGLAVITNDQNYYIDKKGNRVFTCENDNFVHFDFSDGLAQVYDRESGHGFIDRTGKIVIKTKYSLANDFQEGLCAVVENSDSGWGFIDKDGKEVIEARFDQVKEGFQNGLCWVKEKHRWGYINTRGEYVWREQTDIQYGKLDLSKWDLDTLAVLNPLAEHSFEGYDNFVRQGNFSTVQYLTLLLDTLDLTVFKDKYFAYKLHLINGTNDTVRIPVQDAKLKVIQQALNEAGEWQDLDNFINSFCGHSYRSYHVPPGAYQTFPAVFFKGTYQTKFRFKLNLGDKDIYSNSYTGFMNKSQFLNPADVDKTEISVLAN
jgi:hypothetical protein